MPKAKMRGKQYKNMVNHNLIFDASDSLDLGIVVEERYPALSILLCHIKILIACTWCRWHSNTTTDLYRDFQSMNWVRLENIFNIRIRDSMEKLFRHNFWNLQLKFPDYKSTTSNNYKTSQNGSVKVTIYLLFTLRKSVLCCWFGVKMLNLTNQQVSN